MKTWKTIVVGIGLVAMSGVAWGHGAAEHAPAHNGPADVVRIGGNESMIGIPRGIGPGENHGNNPGRVKSAHVTARQRAIGAPLTSTLPRLGAQTISGVGVTPVTTPVVIIAGQTGSAPKLSR